MEGFTGRMLVCSHLYAKSTQTSTTGPTHKGKISAWRLVLTEGELDRDITMRDLTICKSLLDDKHPKAISRQTLKTPFKLRLFLGRKQ